MNAYIDGWRRCVDFSGRSDRAQFWLFHLFMVLFAFAGMVLDAGIDEAGGIMFTALITVPHYLPSLALFIRRLHDIDRSGWWVLIGFIPIVGLVVLIVFACTPSTPGANSFGRPVVNGPHNQSSTAADAPQAATGASHLDQLEKLAALRNSGAIDDAEFDRMKAALLAREDT